MTYESVLIAGEWRQPIDLAGTFQAVNPATREALPGIYPVSGAVEVERAVHAGKEAAEILRACPPEQIAEFLERFAKKIDAHADELSALAHLETALPVEPRLRSNELPRTSDQLRQAAAAAREGSWRLATIDTRSNIRSRYAALGGPVIVFGPNNFPFAFNSAAGGDFAAAVAAGNPVIAKANTGHPGTTRLFAGLAFEAVVESGLPRGTIQLIYRTPRDVGLRLVSHPLTGATGFTGSRAAGMELKAAADRAGKPIYLEMSSVNPIFVLPGALRERLHTVAGELFNSCALGAGQFCTNPGLTIVPRSEDGARFQSEVKALFESRPPGILLGAGGVRGIAEAVEVLQAHGARIVTGGREIDGNGYCYANTLLSVDGERFLEDPHALQTEAFGTVNLMVMARDGEQMAEIAAALEGNLTGCIYSDTQGGDDELYHRIEPVLRLKVGRLLNDKMPTGVAVVPAMNHGGPFPATGHPGFTAVGIPASMLRFAMLQCYDNVRPSRLPLELRDRNPNGRMWRLIDGNWSREDIAV